MSKEVGDEYSSSLADLTVNSKPLINMLTILAEESIEHAAIIVQSVEKHLDKVRPEIKLPVLYLVDSIIKNVGGAYTQLFAQIIVNMFCKVFKQVDEKTRSQMFKLRETWHDVFPSIKLYQLDVKVNLIDPAWPIQARPPQTNIHVNPNFLNRAAGVTGASPPAATVVPPAAVLPAVTPVPLTSEEERMRAAVALKEQELLLLKRKKVEMEVEHARRQLLEQRKALEKAQLPQVGVPVPSSVVIPPAIATVQPKPRITPVAASTTTNMMPIPAPRITPVNSALVAVVRRRDPRLSRQHHTTAQQQEPVLAPPPRRDPRLIKNNSESLPMTSPTKMSKHDRSPSKSVSKHSTYKKDKHRDLQEPIPKISRIDKLPPIPKIKHQMTEDSRDLSHVSPNSPTKRKKDVDSPRSSRKHKKSKDTSPKSETSESPTKKVIVEVENKKPKQKKREMETEKEPPVPMEVFKEVKHRSKERNYIRRNRGKSESPENDVDLRRADLRREQKDSAVRRTEPKDADLRRTEMRDADLRQPELRDADLRQPELRDADLRRDPDLLRAEQKENVVPPAPTQQSAPIVHTAATVPASNGITTPSGDVDLRTLPPTTAPPLQSPPTAAGIVVQSPSSQRKRSPSESVQHEPNKKSKSEKIDELFGNEDVDLRTLPIVDAVRVLPQTSATVPTDPPRIIPAIEMSESPLNNVTPPPAPVISADEQSKEAVDTKKMKDESDDDAAEDLEVEDQSALGDIKDVEGGWARVKEINSPHVPVEGKITPSQLDVVRAKLAEATRGKDGLGRPRLFSTPSDEPKERKKSRSNEDTDMRPKTGKDSESGPLDDNIKIIITQADEQLKTGNINKDQYNVLLMQVLQLNERQKLKEAKQKESLEASKRKLHWLQQRDKKKGTPTPSDEERNRSESPESDRSNDSPASLTMNNNNPSFFGDIDERIAPPIMNMGMKGIHENDMIGPMTSRMDMLDSDMRMHGQMPMRDMGYSGPPYQGLDPRYPMRPGPPMQNMGPRFNPRNWRGPRPRTEEWGGSRGFRHRGPGSQGLQNNWRMPGGMRPPLELPRQPFIPLEPMIGMSQGSNPIPPYIPDGRSSPPPLGAYFSKDGFPNVDPKVFDYIRKDTMKSIFIDGIGREIRYYGTTAIVMLDWDDPREITFQSGRRRISFDDDTLVMGFNEDFINFTMDGVNHKIRFGAPTRELLIDDMWFECLFGGPPIPVLVGNRVKTVHLEGPPPQVTIGKDRRTDLCAGRINIIIDAINIIPVFLDYKPQMFEINGTPHTLRFVDSLRTILINEQPFRVEFGGLPKPIYVNRSKHFIRFSVLPRTIKAGEVDLLGMEGSKPVKPVIVPPQETPTIVQSVPTQDPLAVAEIPSVIPPAVADIPIAGVTSGLDMLASIIPPSVAPTSHVSGYSQGDVSNILSKVDTSVPPPTSVTSVLQNLDITDLYAKLVATGILQTNVGAAKSPEKKDDYSTTDVPKAEVKPIENNSIKNVNNIIKPVNLLKPETLKVKQFGLVSALHSGMQCGNCGARFPPEHTVRYSQHLDWHFRQNRADRDSQRRPHSRRWYYDISDWVQYEEIEDLEEREKSWFERQQEEGLAAAGEAGESTPGASALAAQDEAAVAAPPPSAPPHQLRCAHCGDAFHQFYNQDLEEWQLRRAVAFEEKNYHPICLDEYKTSLVGKEAAPVESVSSDKNPDDSEMKEDQTLDNTDLTEKSEADEPEIVEEEAVEEQESDKDESVVEVLSEHSQEEEEEVELVEDDDVVIKAEPVVQIVVEDADTDEETEKERTARDEAYEIDFAKIKIKQEPIDPDDEPVITAEEVLTAHADTTHTAVVSSIDGNVQLQPTIQATPSEQPRIRINITKPLPPVNNTPPQPIVENPQVQENAATEEEPEIVYKLKPSLEGVDFSVYPPANRGQELSGLCSLM